MWRVFLLALAAARGVAEKIAARLAVLSPQLGKIDPDTEAAFELRRLIGEQLPAFVNDYAQVPATLRTTARNGKTPDAELVDGLVDPAGRPQLDRVLRLGKEERRTTAQLDPDRTMDRSRNTHSRNRAPSTSMQCVVARR